MKNIIFLLTLLLVWNSTLIADETNKASATTTQKENIPLDQFKLELGPMNSEELFVEADAWMAILKKSAKDVYDKKLEITKKGLLLSKEKDNNVSKEILEKDEKEKTVLIEDLAALRNVRKDKKEKLDAILNEIDERIGLDENGKELKEVLKYRRYMDSVTGVSGDVTDFETFVVSAKTWLFSKEGGVLWLFDFLKFMGILFLAYIVSKGLSNGMKKALAMSSNQSQLLSTFIVNIVNKLVMFIGVLMGLAVLGVDMGPVLAFVGAAGFVVAFALQNTLSNFASGLMIMLYRPFDIDDVIDVAGVIGTVKSMTLVTTSIMTADNRMMIVPNNTIWGSIITNVTHSDKRRVDMTFGIGYTDNMDKAQKVLEDVLAEHPLVLKDPAATVQVHELADSSVNFIVRPWTLTSDYWTVFGEITRRVKIRFDEEDISIPYPQQDIHIVTSVEHGSTRQKKKVFTKEHAEKVDVTKMESGKDDDD